MLLDWHTEYETLSKSRKELPRRQQTQQTKYALDPKDRLVRSDGCIRSDVSVKVSKYKRKGGKPRVTGSTTLWDDLSRVLLQLPLRFPKSEGVARLHLPHRKAKARRCRLSSPQLQFAAWYLCNCNERQVQLCRLEIPLIPSPWHHFEGALAPLGCP